MGWGLIVFAVFYLGGLALLGAALSILFAARDVRKEPPYRLGHTLWLCSGCHRLYDHPVKQCPRGHPVIEAQRWEPAAAERDGEGRFDRYATALMPEVHSANRRIL